MSTRTLSGVFYAMNGTGLGHLTRQRNIARDVRCLLRRLDFSDRLEILTTSDASHIANEFLVTKLPSKTSLHLAGLNTRRFAALARNMVSNYLSSVQPNILVVDTDPRGSFAEIAFVQGFAKSLVFVDRHKDERVMEAASYGSTVRLYNLVVVPEDEPPQGVRHPNTCVVGKIQSFLPERALHRQMVRECYGVNDGERLIYVSAGGGGDRKATECLDALISAVGALPRTVVVVGYGPLYGGAICWSRRNVIPTQSPDIVSNFAGFDMAISAGGYNSHEELLAACVPTLFYAQPRGMDRQDLRIQHSQSKGWCGLLESFEKEALTAQVERFLSEEARPIRERLLERSLPEGNVRAAQAILKLGLAHPSYFVTSQSIDREAQALIDERHRARRALFDR